MTPAARLRAMAEKATPRPWHLAMPACDCDSKQYDEESSIETVDGGEAFIPHLPHDTAAFIVHVVNRAHLYADLIEAAAWFDKSVDAIEAFHKKDSWSRFEEEKLISECGTARGALKDALAAIDAADKEGV